MCFIYFLLPSSGFWWIFFLCFQRVTDLEYKKKKKKNFDYPFFAFLYCCFWCFATDDCGKPRVGDCGVEIIIHRGYNAHAMSLCFLFTRGYIHSTTVFFFCSFLPSSIVVVSILLLYLFRRLTITALACNVAKRVEWVEMSWEIKGKICRKVV